MPLRTALLVVGLVAVLLTGCNSSDPMGNVTMGAAEGEAIAVKAIADQSYDPGTIEVPAGEEVTFEIRNADTETHDFAIESAGLNTGTIQPNATATATLVVPEGTTTFVCTFHEAMRGTIEGV